MYSRMYFPALALLCLLLWGCAHYRATLLPQADDSYKVLGQGNSDKQARDAAESAAIKTCRRQSQNMHKLDESQPAQQSGTTQVILHFRCVPRV